MADNGSMLPVSAQQAAQLGAAMAQQSGVINLNTGVPVECYDKPTTTLLVSVGKSAANASLANSAYAWNVDALKDSIATGPVAGKAVTYNDGFDGALINRHIARTLAGRGLPFNQLQISAFDSNGDQSLAILQEMDLIMQTYTARGGKDVPSPQDVAEALRNTANQDGLITVLLDGYVNCVTQWNWQVPADCQINILVSWDKTKF